MRPSSSVRRSARGVQPPPSCCSRTTRTPAAGRPATASSTCVDKLTPSTLSPKRLREAQPNNLRQLAAHHAAFLFDVVAQPFPKSGQDLLGRQPGRADQEHLPEPLLVGQVAGSQLVRAAARRRLL